MAYLPLHREKYRSDYLSFSCNHEEETKKEK